MFSWIKAIPLIIGLVLIVTIIVLSTVIAFQGKEIENLKLEKNMVSQSLDKYKTEMESKDKILKQQSDLLNEAKNVKTWKEYLILWKKINDMK